MNSLKKRFHGVPLDNVGNRTGRGVASCWDWWSGPQVLSFTSGQGRSLPVTDPSQERTTLAGPTNQEACLMLERAVPRLPRCPGPTCMGALCWGVAHLGATAGILPWARPSKPGSYLHLPHLRATGPFTRHLHTSTIVLPPNNPMRMSEESCSFYTTNCADEASTP